jgi:hypothetical protein
MQQIGEDLKGTLQLMRDGRKNGIRASRSVNEMFGRVALALVDHSRSSQGHVISPKYEAAQNTPRATALNNLMWRTDEGVGSDAANPQSGRYYAFAVPAAR